MASDNQSLFLPCLVQLFFSGVFLLPLLLSTVYVCLNFSIVISNQFNTNDFAIIYVVGLCSTANFFQDKNRLF
jgi:hypothetical protein